MTVSSAYTRERKTEAQRSRMIRERERGFAEREQERFRRRGDEWKRNEASEEGGGTKYANELV